MTVCNWLMHTNILLYVKLTELPTKHCYTPIRDSMAVLYARFPNKLTKFLLILQVNDNLRNLHIVHYIYVHITVNQGNIALEPSTTTWNFLAFSISQATDCRNEIIHLRIPRRTNCMRQKSFTNTNQRRELHYLDEYSMYQITLDNLF